MEPANRTFRLGVNCGTTGRSRATRGASFQACLSFSVLTLLRLVEIIT